VVGVGGLNWFVWFARVGGLLKENGWGGYCKRGWRWSPLTTKGRAHCDHLLLGTAIAMDDSPQGKC
jgi:hypothetical protein